MGYSKFSRRHLLVGGLATTIHPILSGSRAGSSDPLKRLRYGVVGAGARSCHGHLPILRDYLPEIQIAALCDVTPENLQRGLQICGGSTRGYTDYRQMLARHSEMDAVIVVIPNYLHAEVALRALEAGKHVLVEKPLATHLADADRMIEAARQGKRILQVGQQMRYSNVYPRIAELLEQKAIGGLEYIVASLFRGDWNPASWQYTDPVTGKRTNWRFLTLTAGSSLLEDGIHELDVIHWLVGAEPRRIQAQGGNNVYRDRETIDHAGMLIDFSNGVRCNFAYTVFTPGVANARQLRLFGSEGEIQVENNEEVDASIVIRRYRRKTERLAVPYLRPEENFWKSGQRDLDIETYRQHRAFHDAIVSGTEPLASGSVGRDAIHISLAGEHCLRAGRILDWNEREAL